MTARKSQAYKGDPNGLPCEECGKTKRARYFQQYTYNPSTYSVVCTACEAKHQQKDLTKKLKSRKKERLDEKTLEQKATREKARQERKRERLAEHLQVKERIRYKRKQDRKIAANLAADRELAGRILARRHLLHFTLKFNANYQPGWVHKLICRKLENFLEEVAEKKGPRLMLFMPPRHGKQIADRTPVLTPSGWKTHGELAPGDYVFHPSGEALRINAISGKTPSDYIVRFSNGQEVRCHENHEWTVWDRTTNGWKTVETKWFTRQTKFGRQALLQSSSRFVYQLPEVYPLKFPERELSMQPYVLGAWLGDGSKGKGCITHTPSDGLVIERIAASGYEISARCTHKQTGVITTYFSGPRPGVAGKMLMELRELGVEHAKHIPETYLRSSIDQRLQLLAGLIDTDGHCDKSGRCRFTTADRALADGVLDLCTTLGFRPYIITKQPRASSSGIQGRKEYYIIGFQPTLDIPCALSRKRPKRWAPQRRVSIISVEFDPQGELGHCLEVNSPDGLYLVGRNLVPTHNSELASKNFPAWGLGKYPEFEFIASSYAVSLPLGFSRKVRTFLRDPVYQQIFNKTRLDAENSSAEGWMTTSGGGYVPAGVAGPITGKGAHCFIIDDPIKDAEEADSDNQREKVWDWWGSTAKTRLAPGGGVLVIQTRWHDDDLSGRMLAQMAEQIKEINALIEETKQSLDETVDPLQRRLLESELQAHRNSFNELDQWEVINFPALATEDEYITEDDVILRPSDPEFENKAKKLLRKKGEALHPERFPASRLRNMKRTMQPRHWSALYQQNPVPDEGAFFKRSMFRYTLGLPMLRDLHLYAAWDLAIGEKQTNDYTVGVIGGLDNEDRLYIIDMIRGRIGNTHEIVEAILNAYVRYNPRMIGIERGQLQLAIWSTLEKRMRERRLYPTFDMDLVPISDKQVRARPLQGRMQQGMVIFPQNAPWLDDVKHEFLRFDGGTYDDIVDACAWLARMVLKHPPPRKRQVRKQKSWRDKLKQFKANSKKTPMAA